MSESNENEKRYDGLEELEASYEVTSVVERNGVVTATLDRPVPDDVAAAQAEHRLIFDDDGMVRTFVAACAGNKLVIDDKHVPATFDAFRAAAGKSFRFARLK